MKVMDVGTNTVLGCIEPEQLVVLASLFAIAITDGLSSEESLALAAFLVVVGDAIAMMDVQRTLVDSVRISCHDE